MTGLQVSIPTAHAREIPWLTLRPGRNHQSLVFGRWSSGHAGSRFAHDQRLTTNDGLYTLLRFGGRQPLCGIGVVSLMERTSIPAAASARTADSRPDPGPLTRTSTLRTP